MNFITISHTQVKQFCINLLVILVLVVIVLILKLRPVDLMI